MVRTESNYRPAVGYLRRSTDRQEQSIGDQRRSIEGYAATHGFDILQFYTDDAISGATSSERAAFLQLIDDAKKKECSFHFVLVYDIKRFGRLDNDEAGYYRHQLKVKGVEVIYVSEGFNGDDTDDLLRPVKQWQARQELKDLSKVTIRGLLSRADGGWWVGGVPPYGYDLAYYSHNNEYICTVRFMSDGSRCVLNESGELVRTVPKGDSIQFTKKDRSRLILSAPERIETVRKIYQWYTVDGIGFKGIADLLNREITDRSFGNYRAPDFKEGWGQTTVGVILKNPVYTGDMVWNRLSFAKFHRICNHTAIPIRHVPGQAPIRNGKEDWIINRDAHPAIISRSVFEASENRRENSERFGRSNTFNCGRGAKSPYMLSGMIKCLHCGHNWVGYTIYKGRKRKDGSNVKTPYYGCNGYIAKGTSVCARHTIRQDKLEAWVVDQVHELLHKHFETARGLKKLRETITKYVQENLPQQSTEIDQVESRIKEIRKIITNLIDNLTSANREYVDIRLNELKRELVTLEARRMDCADSSQPRINVEQVIEQAISLANEFKQVFAEGSMDEKRLFLRAFVKKMEIDPESMGVVVEFVLLPGMKEVDVLKVSKQYPLIYSSNRSKIKE